MKTHPANQTRVASALGRTIDDKAPLPADRQPPAQTKTDPKGPRKQSHAGGRKPASHRSHSPGV